MSAGRPPETFGRYVLLEHIAEGGMGEVWKARSEGGLGLGKTVALKRISERLCKDDEFVAMFVEEARISLALGHPNIVNVFDAGREGGRLYLTMEHVEGRNLHEVIQRSLIATGHPLPERHALYVAAEVLRGLEHAHRRRGPDGRRLGIVHRDISPGNVLCSYEGDVKLTDFGLAKAAIRAYQSVFGTIKGKAAYMPPEQANAEPVDLRADVFGLGAVLYEMLSGKGPYAGYEIEREALDAARTARHPPLAAERPDLSPELVAIVGRAMQLKPEKRWPSAAAMHEALEAYAVRSGYGLSAADFSEFLVGLFEVPQTTVPPHPFARALGAGLGLGAASLSAPPVGNTARLQPASPPPGDPTDRMSRVTTPAAAPDSRGEGSTMLVPPAGRRTPLAPVLVVGLVLVAGLVMATRRKAKDRVTTPLSAAPLVQPAARKTPEPPPPSPSPAPPTAAPVATGPIAQKRPRAMATAPAAEPSPTPAIVPPPTQTPPSPPPLSPEAEAIVSIGSDPWAEVSVDGKRLCRTPLGCKQRRLAPGMRKITFLNPVAKQCKEVTVHLLAGENPKLAVDLEPCP